MELSTAQSLKCKLIFLCDISVYILFIKFISKFLLSILQKKKNNVIYSQTSASWDS